MTTFTFETMTPLQAQLFTVNDRLVFATGTAVQSSVAYLTNGDIVISSGGLSLEFGMSAGMVGFPFQFHSDGSNLWVGGSDRDNVSFGGLGAGNAAFGGANDDFINLGTLGGLAQGNQGDDDLRTSAQATIYGGQGADSITSDGAAHDDFLQGNKGDDLLHGGGPHDTLLGGQGNDTVTGSGFLNGNLGNDSLTGSGQLFGEDGDDTLSANATTSSTLDGGAGNDHLSGFNGSGAAGDSMTAGDGDDFILVHSGRNTIDAGAGDDTVDSSSSDAEVIQGGIGNDKIFAELGGAKTISGGDGDDDIQLNALGSSIVDGGAGNDTIGGGQGSSTILGGDGDDFLSGFPGLHMDGGAGNDTLQGLGPDTLTGGAGADLFFFTDNYNGVGFRPPPLLGQNQVVLDWAHEDHISLTGIVASQLQYQELTASDFAAAVNLVGPAVANHVDAVQVGADVVVFGDISSAGSNVWSLIVLAGRTLADIDASNIVG